MHIPPPIFFTTATLSQFQCKQVTTPEEDQEKREEAAWQTDR
jgi:hypothetical protein